MESECNREGGNSAKDADAGPEASTQDRDCSGTATVYFEGSIQQQSSNPSTADTEASSSQTDFSGANLTQQTLRQEAGALSANKVCSCEDETRHFPVTCGHLEGVLCMAMLDSSTSYRAKAVQYETYHMTVREFHEKGCCGCTGGQSWQMGIYHQETRLQFLLDKWYADRHPRRRLSKKRKEVESHLNPATVLSRSDVSTGQAEPNVLLVSAIAELQEFVDRLIAVIDKMALVGVEQASEWRDILWEALAVVDELSKGRFSIALAGFPGVGKSTFLNAVLMYESKTPNTVPVSGMNACTAVPIIVKRRTVTPDKKPFKGIVNLISFEEFKEECGILLNDLEAQPDCTGLEAEEAKKVSRDKLQALFGVRIEEETTLDELQQQFPDTWSVIKKTLRDGVICIERDSRQELRTNLRRYLTTKVLDGTRTQIWPLVNQVEIEVSGVDILEQGVEFCDLPGLESESKARSAATKEFLANRCDRAWLVTDIVRALDCNTLSDLVENQLATSLKGNNFDVVVTKTEDGVDNVDDEELDDIMMQLDAGVSRSNGSTSKKDKRAAYADNRANLVRKELPNRLNKRLQGEAEKENHPYVLLVSSLEHNKVIEEDPEDAPRIFETDNQTGIPEARTRAQTLAHLNTLTSFKDILCNVDDCMSKMWTSLAEYEPKQTETKKELENIFDTIIESLQDEIQRELEDLFGDWTASLSRFYEDTFYPRLDKAVQLQTAKFDEIVSTWLEIENVHFKSIYNREGCYTLSQRRMATSKGSTRKRKVTFNFVWDLTWEMIESLSDIWTYNFDELIAETLQKINERSANLKERAKEQIRQSISSEIVPDKSRLEAEILLDKVMEKKIKNCERCLGSIVRSFSTKAMDKVEEAVEEVLKPMFQEHKGVKRVPIPTLKEHVKKSMEDNKASMVIRTTMLEREATVVDELKRRISQCGKNALQAVFTEARSCYRFMWSYVPEGEIKEKRRNWMAGLSVSREHLNKVRRCCKQLETLLTV